MNQSFIKPTPNTNCITIHKNNSSMSSMSNIRDTDALSPIKGQSSSHKNETASTSGTQDETELEDEEVMDDPSDNSDLSENNLVNDSNCEIISTIEIEEFKLEAISEEELPTQVMGNQISDDIIKSEPSQSQKEMSGTTSYNPYLCVQCWNSFSLESDYINR